MTEAEEVVLPLVHLAPARRGCEGDQLAVLHRGSRLVGGAATECQRRDEAMTELSGMAGAEDEGEITNALPRRKRRSGQLILSTMGPESRMRLIMRHPPAPDEGRLLAVQPTATSEPPLVSSDDPNPEPRERHSLCGGKRSNRRCLANTTQRLSIHEAGGSSAKSRMPSRHQLVATHHRDNLNNVTQSVTWLHADAAGMPVLTGVRHGGHPARRCQRLHKLQR